MTRFSRLPLASLLVFAIPAVTAPDLAAQQAKPGASCPATSAPHPTASRTAAPPSPDNGVVASADPPDVRQMVAVFRRT